MSGGDAFWHTVDTGGGGGGLPNGNATYVAGSATNTTSAAFVDYGTVSTTGTKTVSSSRLLVAWSSSWFTDTSGTVAEFGIGFNGTDTACGIYYANTRLRHDVVSGVIAVGSGVAAGSYTLQLRWRRSDGTGSCSVDASDFGSISVIEVAT